MSHVMRLIWGEMKEAIYAHIGHECPRRLRWKGVRNKDVAVLIISDCGTCYWSVDTQDVGFCTEELRRLVDDIQGMLLL